MTNKLKNIIKIQVGQLLSEGLELDVDSKITKHKSVTGDEAASKLGRAQAAIDQIKSNLQSMGVNPDSLDSIYTVDQLKAMGFDIRGTGGQVVAPGSVHPDTGKFYTIHNEGEIAPAPQWLLDLSLQEEIEKPALKGQPETKDLGNLDALQISLPVYRESRDTSSSPFVNPS